MLPLKFFGILTVLSIIAVAFSQTSDDVGVFHCPSSCACDERRQLVDCSFRSLARPPQHLPQTVRVLNLAGNRIHRLAAIHFLQLLALEELDLSENVISDLPPDLFFSTPRLKSLRLNDNKLTTIPSLALSAISTLEKLSISKNEINAITANDLSSLKNLHSLDVSKNCIVQMPSNFLDSLPSLVVLQLSGNALETVDFNNWMTNPHHLRFLDVSYNAVATLTSSTAVKLPYLETLNVTANHLGSIETSWFTSMPGLLTASFGSNPLQFIADGSFAGATNLQQLTLSNLSGLACIDNSSFAGLSSLQELDLSYNPNLTVIDKNAFHHLHHLQQLDLSGNALSTFSASDIEALPNLESVRLSGNRWYCGCQLKLLREVLLSVGEGDSGDDVICYAPASLRGLNLMEVNYSQIYCPNGNEEDVDVIMYVRLTGSILLTCPHSENPVTRLAWSSSKGRIIERTVYYDIENAVMNVSYEIQKSSDPISFHSFHYIIPAHNMSGDLETTEVNITGHIRLLANGSLLITEATRDDTGRYRCTVSNNYETIFVVVELRLDYSVMSFVMLSSLVVGGTSAVGFFSIAVILGAIRYFAHVCSPEERAKRRSLRELLTQMRNSSQLERLATYRMSKMDRLSAFKSATMDHLSAFTSEHIGRLRKYKQATVSGVLHQLERLREHYTMQTARIKESYTSNVDRLRHSYAMQRTKLHDRRSVGVQRMRDQYHARAARAREYSLAQVQRLRDQYKQQQQYLLKLLELIDAGSCVSSAVEAECVRAESAIFDAGVIMFDEEARPSHANRAGETGFHLSEACMCHAASSLSLPEMDTGGDGVTVAMSTLLQRSLSVSDVDVGGGHELMKPPGIDVGVIVHAPWQKSLSTPVVCILHPLGEAEAAAEATPEVTPEVAEQTELLAEETPASTERTT